MTATPLSFAAFSIAAPLPESMASISRTLAPFVMSASACVCIVVALPCALSTLKSPLLKPAAWNAFVRYGRSYDSYRADVVVSGSRTPMRPLPLAATSLNFAITAKSEVNESGVSDEKSEEPELDAVVVPDDDSFDEL